MSQNNNGTSHLTDPKYREHFQFWSGLLASTSYNFRLQEPWHSLPNLEPARQKSIAIDEQAANNLNAISGNNDLGNFVLITAACAIVLSKLQPGMPLHIESGLLRETVEKEFEEMTLPVIIDFNETKLVKDAIKKVQEALVNCYTYQNFPIFDLGDEYLRSTNIFITSDALHVNHRPNYFDLIVEVQTKGSAAIVLHNPKGAFSNIFLDLIEKYVRKFLGMVDKSALPIKDIFDDNVASKVSIDKNAVPAIHDVFEEQVLKCPDKVALTDGRTTLTYHQLNSRANQLAHFLINEYKIVKGDRLAVMADRSDLSVIALLATLKTGGTYVPIDTELPEERIKFMTESARVKVLLVHSNYIRKLHKLSSIKMFALDFQLPALKTSAENPSVNVNENDDAYVIYTSGTTGTPKGVLLQHGGFTRMMKDHIETFEISAADRVLQFSSPSFDASLLQIFLPLFSGGTLVLISKKLIEDGESFVRYLRDQQVSVLLAPPSYLSTVDVSASESIRTIITGGEAAKMEDAMRLARTKNYFNSYGPTETSVSVCNYKVDANAAYRHGVPIGKAIPNAVIYIMDKYMNPLPPGFQGEICISGPTVAKGYIDGNAEAENMFTNDPFDGNLRMYRTGDIGCRLPDGNLEYLGRADDQIKIRGYRLEPAEIQGQMIQFGKISRAVVAVNKDGDKDPVLVGYFISDERENIKGLRGHLQVHLPSYSIPQFFVQLTSIPLTINGKIDFTKLPDPRKFVDETVMLKPANDEIEEFLVSVWRTVLDIDRIGVDQNFFEIGGTSLKVIKVFEKLNAKFPGILRISHLFDHPVISSLADVIKNAKAKESTGKQEYAVVKF